MENLKSNYTHKEFLALSKNSLEKIKKEYNTNCLTFFLEDMRAIDENYKIPFKIDGFPCVLEKTIIVSG